MTGVSVACGNEARTRKSPRSVLEDDDRDGGGTRSMKGLASQINVCGHG